MEKQIYKFGPKDQTDGHAGMKEILGGKGANLAEMARIGLPVPPGFTITTTMCNKYYELGRRWPDGLEENVKEHMKWLENVTGKKFGDPNNPLLVSVRSGAKISMPGMMDTILNLGINDTVVEGLAKLTNNERFAWDTYRRFIQMFGDVVMEVPHEKFEEIIQAQKDKKGVKLDTELDANDWREVVEEYKKLIKNYTGQEFPQEPWEQLKMAINAVFRSWNNERAITYRKLNKIPDDLGTAVNIVTMVFGNMGEDSGTGVGFTRNPSTGEKEYYGEYLKNAQGEDVVAGIRTPKPVTELEKEMPQVWEELKKVYHLLEEHYKDMQDFEFTIEKGKLWMLQTRTGKRTAQAAVKIAYDMVQEGLIDKKTAVLRIAPEQVDQLLHKQFDPSVKYKAIAKGLPASPGAAVGRVVFTADEAVEWANNGEKVILVRTETTPEDIHGMHVAEGILTARGGMTSHAAVVARGMGKCCVAGCEAIKINEKEKYFTVEGKDVKVKEGDWISLNGSTGEVILGQLKTVDPEFTDEFKAILTWADEYRRLGIRANADTPVDAKRARDFGAQGIGLCRTEHMFFEEDRIPWVRKMILAKTKEERLEALSHLERMQTEDFYGILKAMEGLPVIIRLLDPPLHEFLPPIIELSNEVVELKTIYNLTKSETIKTMLEEKQKLLARVKELHEFNPMMGHRGCRLGMTHPEIYDMQVRAIINAAVTLKKEGIDAKPEIMIPLVGHVNELKFLAERAKNIADEIIKNAGVELHYMVGTMIEVPRAALTADEIAEYAEFFSFGTNDLTQMTFGYSRDDAQGKFLNYYVETKVLPHDPFTSIDRYGVGKLMQFAVESGRRTRSNIELGICGEHGGDPASIEFCHNIGLHYVSCSPFRVPVARIAAAHAAIKAEQEQENAKEMKA